MSRDLTVFEHADRLAAVVDDYVLKGITNPTKIAKESGLPRADVILLLEEWKQIATNDEWVKDRAAQSLKEFDDSYGQIISELWETLEDAESPRDKNSILKNIADIQAKRQETLQKAGLYDDAALGDQMVLLEDQIEQIRELLKEVAEKFPDAKIYIMERLGKIFKKPQRIDA